VIGSSRLRSRSGTCADDIDVCALHHQRKGQDGRRPKTLEDVYGSTWLAAGAGSVILLWGEAGGELVDLQHLNQPADPIGPWKLEHDQHAGTTTVVAGFDAVAYLRHRAGGATLTEIAAAQWGGEATEAQRKRTERVLRKLTQQTPPRVFVDGQERGACAFTPARYYAADTVDTTVAEKPTTTPTAPIARRGIASVTSHHPPPTATHNPTSATPRYVQFRNRITTPATNNPATATSAVTAATRRRNDTPSTPAFIARSCPTSRSHGYFETYRTRSECPISKHRRMGMRSSTVNLR
jgi:hypothetical protein